MKILGFLINCLLLAPVAQAAIPGFTPAQLRQSIMGGERLAELIAEVEKLPGRDQLPRLIESLEFTFPADTRIVHFADIPWNENLSASEAIQSFNTQREFLNWWGNERLNIVWDEMPMDIMGAADRDKFDFFVNWRQQNTPATHFAQVPQEDVRKNVVELYTLGAAGILFKENMVPSLFSGSSTPLVQFGFKHDRNDDLVINDLNEIAAILRIEALLQEVPEIHQSVVLLSAAGHGYEEKFQNIPNLTFSTVLAGPAKDAYMHHRATRALKAEIQKCEGDLGGVKFKFINI